MSFSISVTIDTAGLEAIAAKLDSYPPIVGKKIGGQVASEARILAPYDTGALKDSIQEEYPGGNILARINVFQDYGIYQELGFHHWRSGQFIQNAFLVPAVEHWAGEFLSPATWAPIFAV
jgi:hypothetical protein